MLFRQRAVRTGAAFSGGSGDHNDTWQYNDRNELTRSDRFTGTTPGSGTAVNDLDRLFTYDQLGNRLTKADSVSLKSTEYFYDTETANQEPNFPTKNNRLMRYEERIDGTLVRTVKYTYYKTGDVSNIAIKDHYVNGTLTPGSDPNEDDPDEYDWIHDLALYYCTNGSLRLALSDKWKPNANGDPDPATYVPLTAREFRYDSGRARYLYADYHCNGSTEFANWTLDGGAVNFTDYRGGAGVSPTSDSTITWNGSSHSLTENTRYFGFAGRQTLSGGSPTDTRYLHGDLIESNVLASDPIGAAVASTAYTAFGEPVPDASNPSDLGTRYQYAGGFGYEAGMLTRAGVNSNLSSVSLAHVGARWYDASIGRFVQRDPVGLHGGVNMYSYVQSEPVALTDPSGLLTDHGNIRPSDLPPNWDKMSRDAQRRWLEEAIRNSKSKAHAAVLRGWLKRLGKPAKLGGRFLKPLLVVAFLLDPPESAADAVGQLCWPLNLDDLQEAWKETGQPSAPISPLGPTPLGPHFPRF